MSRPFDPRRLLRPLRLALFGAVLLLLWRGCDGLRVVTLPSGPRVIHDIGPGEKVLVQYYGARRLPQAGDVAVYLTADHQVAYGRLEALAGDAIEIDIGRCGVRRSGTSGWRAADAAVLDRLPLQSDECLVLAEDPIARAAGAVVPLNRLVGRFVVALPF